jgi:hypothetical protein
LKGKIKYQFSADLWKDKAEGGWYFVTLPQDYSDEIRNELQWQEEGWGRMKASAEINELNWDTSIWFDTKSKRYILPVKAVIRKKLSLKDGDKLEISVFV